MPTPRLRMFAGPNGSGKSTLKTVLPAELLGVYLNPDEVEQELRQKGAIDLRSYGVGHAGAEAAAYLAQSRFLIESGHLGLDRLRGRGGTLGLGGVEADSYVASVLVSFLRRKLIESKASLTLATVMSHPSKVELLKEAQEAGYRTYLYCIATEDPEINRNRILNRVKLGGHPVPEEKIAERYH